jgi:iron complex outermembrane recepter protein
VRNLLDEEQPTTSTGYYYLVGNAPLYRGYDYTGRQYFVNVTYTF